jgi:pimeloyl-ACP methyl ester carboxylesterase
LLIDPMPLKQQIRYCTAPDGVRIAYATAGRGPPLFKVGNWLSHMEFDLTSPVWGHVLEALCETHTLVRYDQRGTGLSDREVEQMSFDIWLTRAGAGCAAAARRWTRNPKPRPS